MPICMFSYFEKQYYLVSCPTQKDAPTFMSRRRTALARLPLISAKAAIDSSSTFSAFGRNLLYILSFCGLNPKTSSLFSILCNNNKFANSTWHCLSESLHFLSHVKKMYQIIWLVYLLILLQSLARFHVSLELQGQRTSLAATFTLTTVCFLLDHGLPKVYFCRLWVVWKCSRYWPCLIGCFFNCKKLQVWMLRSFIFELKDNVEYRP